MGLSIRDSPEVDFILEDPDFRYDCLAENWQSDGLAPSNLYIELSVQLYFSSGREGDRQVLFAIGSDFASHWLDLQSERDFRDIKYSVGPEYVFDNDSLRVFEPHRDYSEVQLLLHELTLRFRNFAFAPQVLVFSVFNLAD